MGQSKPGTSTPLLQRRIGLCGDATRAPTGACKQQKGRMVFTTKAIRSDSFCWSRKKAKNPPHPNHPTSETKSRLAVFVSFRAAVHNPSITQHAPPSITEIALTRPRIFRVWD